MQPPSGSQKSFLVKNFGKRHSPRRMKAPAPTSPDSLSAVAKRLRTIRWLANKGNQTAFAEGRLKIGVKRWNNMERGGALSKEVAFKLVRVFPAITTDWLWFGRIDHLSMATQDALEKAQRELEDAEAGKGTMSPGKRSRGS